MPEGGLIFTKSLYNIRAAKFQRRLLITLGFRPHRTKGKKFGESGRMKARESACRRSRKRGRLAGVVAGAGEFPLLGRPLSRSGYLEVVAHARGAGLERAEFQGL
jgi:hypothetical protein